MKRDPFKDYPIDSVFSGVFNVKDKKLTYCPSGDTVLKNGEIPNNRVVRNSGHMTVLQNTKGQGGFKDNIAVTIFKKGNRQIKVEFKSSSVTRQFNRQNKLSRSQLPPPEFKDSAIEAIKKEFPEYEITYK